MGYAQRYSLVIGVSWDPTALPQYVQAPWTIDGREEPELEQPELPMLTRFTETGQGRRGLPPRGRSP